VPETKPILAVAELVWNALDADAKKVRVELSYNKLGGLQAITIIDNGHGISYTDAIPAFENLGGSWKNRHTKSKGERRLLHGKAGKGRFLAG
jgi:DNA mismatch repair ATPase MutL